MLPPYAFELAGLLLGLLLGSFLNVCIERVPRGESIVTPRSRCPVCRHAIRWYDNIPVLSWLLLRGRCRDCKARISWQYPAVELAAGMWLLWIGSELQLLWAMSQPDVQGLRKGLGLGVVTSFWQYSPAFVMLTGTAVLGLLLIALIVIDWQTHRLPDAFTLTGIAAALFLVCTQAIFLQPGEDQIIFAFKHLRLTSPGSFAARGNVFLTGPEALIFGRIAAVCGAALLLLAVRWTYRALRHREGLGLGDVKLLSMIAAFLGFEQAVLVLFIGTMLATLYAVYLVARRRANALTRLPFGSFLGLAGLFAALRGEEILAWYRSLFA